MNKNNEFQELSQNQTDQYNQIFSLDFKDYYTKPAIDPKNQTPTQYLEQILSDPDISNNKKNDGGLLVNDDLLERIAYGIINAECGEQSLTLDEVLNIIIKNCEEKIIAGQYDDSMKANLKFFTFLSRAAINTTCDEKLIKDKIKEIEKIKFPKFINDILISRLGFITQMQAKKSSITITNIQPLMSLKNIIDDVANKKVNDKTREKYIKSVASDIDSMYKQLLLNLDIPKDGIKDEGCQLFELRSSQLRAMVYQDIIKQENAGKSKNVYLFYSEVLDILVEKKEYSAAAAISASLSYCAQNSWLKLSKNKVETSTKTNNDILNINAYKQEDTETNSTPILLCFKHLANTKEAYKQHGCAKIPPLGEVNRIISTQKQSHIGQNFVCETNLESTLSENRETMEKCEQLFADLDKQYEHKKLPSDNLVSTKSKKRSSSSSPKKVHISISNNKSEKDNSSPPTLSVKIIPAKKVSIKENEPLPKERKSSGSSSSSSSILSVLSDSSKYEMPTSKNKINRFFPTLETIKKEDDEEYDDKISPPSEYSNSSASNSFTDKNSETDREIKTIKSSNSIYKLVLNWSGDNKIGIQTTSPTTQEEEYNKSSPTSESSNSPTQKQSEIDGGGNAFRK